MQVNLCVTSNDMRDTRKSVSVLRTTDIVNKEPVDLLRPRFAVEAFPGFEQCNYVKIPRFNRSYFVTKREMDNYGILWITCETDDLTNWWSYVKNKTVLVERQEFVWNPYIQDSLLPVRTERKISFKKIGNIGNPNGHNIVLTVGGGKQI